MTTNLELSPLTSVKEISKEWIGNVLSLKMNSTVSVESFETKITETKAGFLSDICFVRVVVIAGNSISSTELCLVVKVMPQHEEIVAFMKMGNLGQREVAFYTHAGSEDFLGFCRSSGLDHPVPDVYWSCIKDDSLTLVLDDLNAKGYRMSLLPDGNDLQQIKCTFNAIAVIHAYGYATISKRGKEYFHVPYDSSYLDDILCTGLRMQIDMYDGTPLAETLNAFLSLNKELISTSERNPLIDTLVHGDLWAGNVMFTDNDKAASIYDWQFACVGNPLCDVTSMLLMSAEPTVYEEHLNDALESYWKSFTNALMKNGVGIPIVYEDLVKNLEKLWMHGFMFFTASLPDMMANHKITEARVRKVMSFLEKMGNFSAFLKLHKK